MPSPFPGMDPYIETPNIWSDFHHTLAAQIRTQLNSRLGPRYVARSIPYVTYEEVEISESRRVQPDVGVWRTGEAARAESATATAVARSPVQSSIPLQLPVRLERVEIQEVATRELVAVIEILSPVNKRSGKQARDEYLRKRHDILHSTAHLIEIDLLREGMRPPLDEPVPGAPYYVTLSRSEGRPRVDVWPIQLWEPLPDIPIPLRDPDPDVQLELGAAVTAVYEGGAYDREIDYSQPPPPPPLTEAEARWWDERRRSLA